MSDNSLASVMNWIMWILFLLVFAYINRELEIMRIVREIEVYLSIYRRMKDKAINSVLTYFKEIAARQGDRIDLKRLEERVAGLVESVIINPESQDPYGLMTKLKHIVLTEDRTLTDEISRLIPNASRSDVENLKDLISAAHELNYIYKSVDHLYRQGKRFKSIWILMQLQAQLPFISEYVNALDSSLEGFSKGYPIGDAAGPLVAATFLRKYGCRNVEEIAENTIACETEFMGRRVVVIKAKGPGGVTGRIDDGLRRLIELRGIKPKAIITVDAALKFEGEPTGMTVEGVGVAMGGIGFEKYNIEEIATKNRIPLYAVLIKMSMPEALSVMSKEVASAIPEAVKRVETLLTERIEKGETAILVGVGNTVGVAP